MELRCTNDGRECVAQFPTEAEAQRCAELLLRTRDGLLDLQLLDNDGKP